MIIRAVSLSTLIIVEKDSTSTKKLSSRMDTNWLIKENSAGTFHAKQCSIRILSHTDGVGDGSSPCRLSLFRRASGRRRGRHIRRLLYRAHFHIVEKCGDTTRMTYPTRWVTDGADAVVKASVRDKLETTAYNHDSPGEDRNNLARQTRFFKTFLFGTDLDLTGTWGRAMGRVSWCILNHAEVYFDII